jgi:hypothetical protein
MDRENSTNKEKIYLSYINVVITPTLSAFMIFL